MEPNTTSLQFGMFSMYGHASKWRTWPEKILLNVIFFKKQNKNNKSYIRQCPFLAPFVCETSQTCAFQNRRISIAGLLQDNPCCESLWRQSFWLEWQPEFEWILFIGPLTLGLGASSEVGSSFLPWTLWLGITVKLILVLDSFSHKVLLPGGRFSSILLPCMISRWFLCLSPLMMFKMLLISWF